MAHQYKYYSQVLQVILSLGYVPSLADMIVLLKRLHHIQLRSKTHIAAIYESLCQSGILQDTGSVPKYIIAKEVCKIEYDYDKLIARGMDAMRYMAERKPDKYQY